MIRFIESIKLFNGVLHNIELHQQRTDRTTQHFYQTYINLSNIKISNSLNNGLYKCRIIYDSEIRQIEFHPYTPKQRNTVRIMECNNIDYKYKMLEREPINNLWKKAQTDDIIIVRNGLVTDSAYANLVFENSLGLFTPKTPLLEGTQRQFLLNNNKIQLADISPNNLSKYRWLHFINAMQPLGCTQPFYIKDILQ